MVAHGEDGFSRAHPISNSWGGWPSAVGISPFLVLRVTVSGTANATTGYLINIQELDRLLRIHAIPLTASRLSTIGAKLTGESLVRGIAHALRAAMVEGCELEALRLWTTPYLSCTVRSEDLDMVELTQCFEFSASHRLHVHSMSDEQNRAYFGKCNNPTGHGHNYQVEVTVARDLAGDDGTVLPLPRFEAVVKEAVIDRLDHRHLNSDVAEFAAVNPSVENIARVIWGYLDGRLSPAVLRRVRVWETAKTYAEYEGGD